ncbi:response regulator receiver protein [Methylobacterium sp. 4-46]|uniref:response regulator n=1 Tax=unclassified Methylobacterium TaxID=2615210 RepID=UPI000152E43D|nr:MULTISPECIES: response regulator [Methylobacterium]ACA16797.1 response regulator receiver protein [Methylobacterium sp. 4-46]WFT82492.1 response regulator [Methylobacterium nodulans]
MLTGRRVLIVEDEMLIALELSDLVTDAQGSPVGPARTNREALALLDREPVDVAILDLNLADGEATPTAERLIRGGIPVLVCTGGVLPRAMRLMWPDLPVHRKPLHGDRLLRALEALCPHQAGEARAP